MGNIFKNSITHLAVTIDRKEFASPFDMAMHRDEDFLIHIFHTFTNLIELDLNQSNIASRPLLSVYELSSMTCYSTSLTHLSISVQIFNDCLCLLDGRLSQLRKLYIFIVKIYPPSLSIENLVRKYISTKMLNLIFLNLIVENIT